MTGPPYSFPLVVVGRALLLVKDGLLRRAYEDLHDHYNGLYIGAGGERRILYSIARRCAVGR